MRITNSMYYKGVFSPNKNRISQSLFDVNKQISSGLKIEYAKDDVSVFSDTMRLDNEINTLEQAKSSTTSALKISTQTDKTLNDFQTTLDRMKVLMVNAANASQNGESLDAIYKELKGLRSHLINLGNTSINGKYLFSGSAFDIKPIDKDGKYYGNDKELKAFGGSNIQIQYNIPGSELFLGEESQRHRKISTNIKNLNQSELHPDIMNDPVEPGAVPTEKFITRDDTIRDLMGDTDNDPTNDPVSHFYIKGVKHNGETFSKELSYNSTQKVGDLLDDIADLYGKNSVDVRLNEFGQIEITDKIQGSSKLDFHMFGAVDFDLDGNGSDDAGGKTIDQLQNLDVTLKDFTNSNKTVAVSDTKLVHNPYDATQLSLSGKYIDLTTDQNAKTDTLFSKVVFDRAKQIQLSGTATDGSSVSATFSIGATTNMQDFLDALDTNFDKDDSLSFYLDNGKIKVSSSDDTSVTNLDISLQTQDSSSNSVKGFGADSFLAYDRIAFDKSGATLSSNESQIVKDDNSYATMQTKLSEVADLSQGTNGTLDGEKLYIEGVNVNGEYVRTTINLLDSGSTYTIEKDSNGDGTYDTAVVTNFDIFNLEDPRSATSADNVTYKQLSDIVNMTLTDQTPASNSADDYDTAIKNSENYAQTSLNEKGKMVFKETGVATTDAKLSIYDANNEPGVLSFQKNSSLTVTDPKTDFFSQLDKAIEAVRKGRVRADGNAEDPRNVGIQNGIQIIDDIGSHVTRVHTKIGALSNSLQQSADRSEMLSISTKTLRSDVLDTDIAEASMKLNQLTLNYQAILSTIGRVSKLSLVNYL